MAGLGPDTWLPAALPIREQPDFPQQAGTSVPEAALLAGMLIAVLAMARAIIRWRARRDRDQLRFDEERARAEMDRLCDHGWTATMTLHGQGAGLSSAAGPDRGARVRVEWAELGAGDGGRPEPLVVRRLWASNVGAALRGMVEDRRLDFELEQIERAQTQHDSSGGE